MYVHRVNRVVFSTFGGLGGDFCKKTYEPKLFGMHIRSVLSGLHAENVNTDPKCRFNLCLGLGKCACGGSKMRVFRSLEGHT